MKKRLVYIDVIRGICIFVVIYTHIAGFCMTKGYPKTGLHQFLTSFFLIMFYFISGMMSYKENMLPNIRSLLQFFLKKFRTLLIPSIVVMGGYAFLIEHSLKPMLQPWNLWVTWFTYVLFFISAIFGISMFVLSKIKNKSIRVLFLLVVAFLAYLLSRQGLDAGKFEQSLKLGSVLYYLPFFFMGAICKMQPLVLEKIESNKNYFFIVSLLVFVVFEIHSSPLFIKNILVVLLVYLIVKGYTKNSLGKANGIWVDRLNAKCVHFFEVLGRHSLEIYFLHFMLLFKLPVSLVNYLSALNDDSCWWGSSSISFAEFLVVGSLSALIAIVCILLAGLLGQIPYMNSLLFGKIN